MTMPDAPDADLKASVQVKHLEWLGATLPFVMVVALTALELLVAVLQAYVFAILTCIYLNDAVHMHH